VDTLTRTLAATASGDFSAKLWCATTGKELCEFKHKHVVKSIDFSRDSEHIATGCQDGLMRVYQTCKPEQPPTEFRVAPSGSDECITKLSFLPQEDNLVVLGQRKGKIQLWDIRTPTAPATTVVVAKNGGDVMDIEINPVHGVIVAACESRVVFLSLAGLAVVREYQMPSPMHFKEEGGASLSPDGTKFIAGGSDLWLREFDVASGEVLQTFKGHHGPIRCVRYHPSGDVGSSGSEDATIRMWGLNDGRHK
jgi:serine-threonine kinase receptor-associated protein